METGEGSEERQGQGGQGETEGGGEHLRRLKTKVARRKYGQAKPSKTALVTVSGRD